MKYKENYIQYTIVLLYVFLLSFGVYFEEPYRLPFLLGSLVLMALAKDVFLPICFFCSTLITDNLQLSESISYGAIAPVVFVFKELFSERRYAFNKKLVVAVCALLIFQFISIASFNNNDITLFRMSVNLIVFLYFTQFSASDNRIASFFPAMLTLTVGLGCLISFFRSFDYEFLGVVRYSGIWNDDNFCSMYCLLGIVSAIVAVFVNKKIAFLAIPAIGIELYTATMAMSRTFIFVSLIMTLLVIYNMMMDRKVSSIRKIGILLLGLVLLWIFWNNSASFIISNRGLVNEGDDWSNNRLRYTNDALQLFINNPVSWFFGVGLGNGPGAKKYMGYEMQCSHNTFVDLFVEPGLIFGLLIFALIIRYLYIVLLKVRQTKFENIIPLVMLLYMSALTMTQYSILYVILGMIVNRTIGNNQENLT